MGGVGQRLIEAEGELVRSPALSLGAEYCLALPGLKRESKTFNRLWFPCPLYGTEEGG